MTRPSMRRSAVFALSSVLSLASGASCAHPAAQPLRPTSSGWFATWTASPSDAPPRPPRDSVDRVPSLVNQTVRLIVRTSIGGDRARVRLSNEYGDRALVIGAAH